MKSTLCVCGSGQAAQYCCLPLHQGQWAETPEQLMRSRYAAFVEQQIDYLVNTTHPAQQHGLDLPAIWQWSQRSQWQGLEVLHWDYLNPEQTLATVSFIARWAESGVAQQHQECSMFIRRADQRWYFLDPTVQVKTKRNKPCPCLSGKKFKQCCLRELALLSCS